MEREQDEFIDARLEMDVIREVVYWSTIGGYDVLGDHHLVDEKDLFTDERYMIWAGILYSYDKIGSIDVGSVIQSLPGGGMRAEAVPWITEASAYGSYLFVPMAESVEKLKTLAACRAVRKAAMRLRDIVASPESVRTVAYSMCSELEQVVVSGIKSDDVGDEFDRYTEVMRKGGTWVTGVNQLDHHGRFGGYYGIVGARSHHGKTAVIVSMLLNQLLKGFSVFLWQGEQTRAQMYLRFVCQLTGMKSWEVLNSTKPEDVFIIGKARKLIDSWLARKADKPALYMYDGRKTVFEVLRLIRSARQKHPICIAYIDQLSKFSRDAKASREAAYSDISEVLAVESLKLKQPILVAHQLNIKERKDAAGPPAFWQVKDCGRLYEDCDIWITVDRPEVDAERMLEFDKARDKFRAKGDLESADRFDVRGRVKIKVEKDRVATFGCHEEWLGFDHECGRIFSRFKGPDELSRALKTTQMEMDIATGKEPDEDF